MNTNLESLSLEEIINYILKDFHIPTKKYLEELKSKVSEIKENDIANFPKLEFLGELFIQFKWEYLKHMEREELITFPTIIKYEKILTNNSKNLKNLNETRLNYIEMKNEHDVFASYLLNIISLFDSYENLNFTLQELSNSFKTIQKNNEEHAYIENNIIYPKWNEFQDKLIKSKN